MGGKQARRRQHFYFCIAVLILANLCGCALYVVRERPNTEGSEISREEASVPQQGRTDEKSPVIEAHPGAIQEGRGEIALDTLRDDTSAGSKPSADQALFSTALNYADNRNPARDYSKSVLYLRRLIREHPASPLTVQARILIGLLQETEQLRRTVDKLNAIMEESKKVDVEIEEKRRERQR